MNIDQDETDAALLHLTLECARPSWRFRVLFGARERQLLGFAINTFMSQRQQNLLMNKLGERYGNYGGLTGKVQGEQISSVSKLGKRDWKAPRPARSTGDGTKTPPSA